MNDRTTLLIVTNKQQLQRNKMLVDKLHNHQVINKIHSTTTTKSEWWRKTKKTHLIHCSFGKIQANSTTQNATKTWLQFLFSLGSTSSPSSWYVAIAMKVKATMIQFSFLHFWFRANIHSWSRGAATAYSFWRRTHHWRRRGWRWLLDLYWSHGWLWFGLELSSYQWNYWAQVTAGGCWRWLLNHCRWTWSRFHIGHFCSLIKSFFSPQQKQNFPSFSQNFPCFHKKNHIKISFIYIF